MIHDPDIAALYKANCEMLGRFYPNVGAEKHKSAASTDMGNVSLAIPSIQPMIGIHSFPAVNHQKDFAAQCVTEAADQAVYDGALGMAWTAVDMGMDVKLRERLLAKRTPED
jgi:metal-dependent amidase/aminoacylase/carboxypeptidase family protein